MFALISLGPGLGQARGKAHEPGAGLEAAGQVSLRGDDGDFDGEWRCSEFILVLQRVRWLELAELAGQAVQMVRQA